MSEPVAQHDPFQDAVVWESPSPVESPPVAVEPPPELGAPSEPVSDEPVPSPEPGDDGPPVADEPGEEEGEPVKPTGQQRLNLRFSELTQQRDAARQETSLAQQEADYWKNRALQSPGTEPQQAPPPQQPPQDGLQRDQAGRPLRPRQEQYATTGDYEQALDVYEAVMDDWRLQRSIQVAREQVRQETALTQVQQQYPDYQQVVGGSRVQVNPHVSAAIQASSHMHGLLYHLAKNPGLERDLAPLTGNHAFLAVARLELALQAPPANGPPSPDSPEPARLPPAPPPIQPARGSGGSTPAPNLETMSMEQFIDLRNKEAAVRRY